MRIPAGETLPVQKPGDFIYLKFADRQIAVIEDQSRFEMEAGDKYVSRGGFSSFQVQNLDQKNPVYVIFAVGKGDYHRQIVQGEISVVPGIRKSSGEFVQDTRWTLTADVDFTNVTPETFTFLDEADQVSWPDNAVTCAYFPRENRLWVRDNNNTLRYKDLDTGTVSASQSKLIGSNDQFQIQSLRGCLTDSGTFLMSAFHVDTSVGHILEVDANLTVLGIWSLGVVPADEAVFQPLLIDGELHAMVPTGGDSGDWYKYRAGQWSKIAAVDLGTYGDSAYHAGDNRVVISAYGYGMADWEQVTVFDATTGEALAPQESDFNLKYGGHYIPSKRQFVHCRATASVYFIVSETWTRTAQGTFETCAGGYAFEPEATQTEAALVARDTDTGTELRGEVLRALLELWLGQFVADDYLDHIYRVEFDNANGRAPVTVTSGGTSFAGAKIDDNFQCVFPQTVRITLDNNLTTKD